LGLFIGGYGITINSYGDVNGGVVTGIGENIWNGADLWIVEGISISATAVYEASLTASTDDDGALIVLALSGNDKIYLSDYDDRMSGFGGNDVMFGSGGNDYLSGSDGNDVLLGGSGADYLHGGSGIDRAEYTDATAGVLADLQYAGRNTGIAAGDTYVSIENLYGSRFDDNLRGDAAANVLWGHNGNDRLYGRGGNDILYGQGGNDILYGQGGNDRLIGNGGNDRLYGQGGNDRLYGGAGGDTFVFQNGFGQDKIEDFNISRSGERISLGAVSKITSFTDLTNNHLSQSGSNAIIDDGQGNTITLLGVNMGDLAANDFLF
jgi:Ca2+-binding RTX toxin-like protein